MSSLDQLNFELAQIESGNLSILSEQPAIAAQYGQEFDSAYNSLSGIQKYQYGKGIIPSSIVSINQKYHALAVSYVQNLINNSQSNQSDTAHSIASNVQPASNSVLIPTPSPIQSDTAHSIANSVSNSNSNIPTSLVIVGAAIFLFLVLK